MKSGKKNKKPDADYVACKNCGMEPICRPVATGGQNVPLSDAYLNRRNVVLAGESLFARGEAMTNLYAVSSGVFRIVQISPDGEEHVLGFRFPGELLGDDAFYSGSYSYTAIAITDSSACSVLMKEFNACSELVPSMQRNIIELLSRQNHNIQQQMSVLVARKNAEQQLVAFLLNIARRQMANEGLARRFDLAISRDSIANFLGFRRETLSRLLSRLQKKGLIRLDARQLELLDPVELSRLAGQQA